MTDKICTRTVDTPQGEQQMTVKFTRDAAGNQTVAVLDDNKWRRLRDSETMVPRKRMPAETTDWVA